MVAVPGLSLTVQDGGLGVIDLTGSEYSAKIGTCSSGTVNTVYSISTPAQARSVLGYGPLAEACIYHIRSSGKPLYAVRATGGTAGTASAVTQTGSGPAVTVAGAPRDSYQVIVEVTGGGILGAATMKYTLDNGDTYTPDIVIPAGGTYALGETGLTLTFAAGTYVVGATYAITCTEPRATLGNLGDAWDALRADRTKVWRFVHVVGGGADASASAGIVGQMDTDLAAAALERRYVHAVCEAADVTTALLITAFAAVTSKRVGLCDGYCELRQGDRAVMRRSIAWPYAARLAARPVSIDPASLKGDEIPDPALLGVVSITKDASSDASGNNANFTTLRTHLGLPGYYVTNGLTLAPPGSDYQLIQYREIMDLACSTAAGRLLGYLSSRLQVDPATGRIATRSAIAIDADMSEALREALVRRGHAASASFAVDRTANILSTQTFTGEVRITPPGYAKTITTTLTLVNPALTEA